MAILSSFYDFYRVYKHHEKPASTLYHHYVPKKIAIVVGWICYSLKVSPNMMSAISFLLLVTSLPLLVHGNYAVAIILSQISYSFDCADGVIARMTDKQSSFGGMFDIFLDRVGSVIICLTILYLLTELDTSYPNIMLLGICVFMIEIYQILNLARVAHMPESKNDLKSVKKRLLYKIPYEFADTGTYLLIIFVGFALDALLYVVIFYGVLYALGIAKQLLVFYRFSESSV